MNEEKNVNSLDDQASEDVTNTTPENTTTTQENKSGQSQEQMAQGNKAEAAQGGEDKDAEENSVIAALSYLGLLVLIPLLVKKESKFAQFHAKQGVIMIIAFVVGAFVFWIPVFGWGLWLFLVAIDIIALVKALSGKYWELPIIGGLAKKINL